MCEVLQQQGGESTEIDDPNCTHVVSLYNIIIFKYFLKKEHVKQTRVIHSIGNRFRKSSIQEIKQYF